MHKVYFLILLLLLSLLNGANITSKDAQKLFVEGHYTEALNAYSNVALSQTGVKRANAKAMRAIIFEEYLGEVDSALAIYAKLLEEPLPQRLKKRWKRKEQKLLALGAQKEVYGSYRRSLISRQDTKVKVEELVTIFEKHPDFIKREELGRLIITQYNEIGSYRKSYNILKKLVGTGSEFEPSVIEQAKRNAFREFQTYFAFIYLGLIFILSILILFKINSMKWLKKISPFLGVWGVITAVYQIVYLIWFKQMDNNPFEWYAPLVLMGGLTLPFLWISLVQEKVKKGYSFILIAILPALCGIYLVVHTFLYMQKQPMELMDVFSDRLQEAFGKPEKGTINGQNKKD